VYGRILQLIGGITSVKIVRTGCLAPFIFLSLISLPDAQANGHVALAIGNAASVAQVGDFYLNLHEGNIDTLKKVGPSTRMDAWRGFISKDPSGRLIDVARGDRLAAQAEALEANNARLARQRMTPKRAMTERVMKMQSYRERAEQPIESETGRLPPAALKSTSNCQEINARAQIGDISETDRAALRECH
jgi:hypothetical protein